MRARGSAMWRRSAWGPLLSAVCAVLLGGCAGSGVSSILPILRSDEAPWRLPAEAAPTQRLFRARYEGPEAEGDFRLTLYLASTDSYRLQASGGLPARKLWELALDPEGAALFLDHREKTLCRTPEARNLRLPVLADLPVSELPKVLLGRVPGTPEGRASRGDGRFSFVDAAGRRWDGEEEAGAVVWWARVDSGSTSVWWRRQDDGSSRLVDQERGHDLTWEESVREVLVETRIDLVEPAGFRTVSCTANGEPEIGLEETRTTAAGW